MIFLFFFFFLFFHRLFCTLWNDYLFVCGWNGQSDIFITQLWKKCEYEADYIIIVIIANTILRSVCVINTTTKHNPRVIPIIKWLYTIKFKNLTLHTHTEYEHWTLNTCNSFLIQYHARIAPFRPSNTGLVCAFESGRLCLCTSFDVWLSLTLCNPLVQCGKQ